MENLVKIGREIAKGNELGFREMAAIISPLSIYVLAPKFGRFGRAGQTAPYAI
jgi:hypothetical protein